MDEKYTIYNTDFFTLPDQVFSNSINLALTSPPYYNVRSYDGNVFFKTSDDWLSFCFNTIVKLNGMLVEGGVIWWNTAALYENSRVLTTVYELVVNLNKVGIFLIDDIPWLKTSFVPRVVKNRPLSAWEHNFVFSSVPEKSVYYRDQTRRPYKEATLSRMKYTVNSMGADDKGNFSGGKTVKPHPDGALHPNYLLLPQDYTKRPHPAPMTPQLASWAIKAYSKEGDVVFDPFCGIGTTLVEAVKLNRYAIGVDINENYLQLAKDSLARLLNGEPPYKFEKV